MYPLLTKLIRFRCVDADLELEVHKIAKTKKKEEKKEELRNYLTVSLNNGYTLRFIFEGTNMISFDLSKPIQVWKLYLAPNKAQCFFNQMHS